MENADKPYDGFFRSVFARPRLAWELTRTVAPGLASGFTFVQPKTHPMTRGLFGAWSVCYIMNEGPGGSMETDLVADRIRSNPQTFSGKPTIRDTRVAVEHVLGMMADGASTSEILENYPFLDEDDVRAAIAYAWRIVSHEQVEPLVGSNPA